MLGQDAFGVKLHAFNVQTGVFDTHDFAVIGPGRDLQAGRASGALDRQRVVAVDRELPRQAFKHALLRGADDRGLAVHELLRANDVAAKCRANRLMAQADTQNRQLASRIAMPAAR